MDLGELLPLLKSLTPAGGVLAIMLWLASKRETRLISRIVALEEQIKNTLIPLVRRCGVALNKNSTTLDSVQHLLESKTRRKPKRKSN
jgi:hypothetical protein